MGCRTVDRFSVLAPWAHSSRIDSTTGGTGSQNWCWRYLVLNQWLKSLLNGHQNGWKLGDNVSLWLHCWCRLKDRRDIYLCDWLNRSRCLLHLLRRRCSMVVGGLSFDRWASCTSGLMPLLTNWIERKYRKDTIPRGSSVLVESPRM